jgi:hypothetical protein
MHLRDPGSRGTIRPQRRREVAMVQHALNSSPGEAVPRSAKVRIDDRGAGLCDPP